MQRWMPDETPLSPAPASACGSCCWGLFCRFGAMHSKPRSRERSARTEASRVRMRIWGLTPKPYSMRNSESIRRLSSSVTNAFSSFCAPQKRKATTEPQAPRDCLRRAPSLKPNRIEIPKPKSTSNSNLKSKKIAKPSEEPRGVLQISFQQCKLAILCFWKSFIASHTARFIIDIYIYT